MTHWFIFLFCSATTVWPVSLLVLASYITVQQFSRRYEGFPGEVLICSDLSLGKSSYLTSEYQEVTSWSVCLLSLSPSLRQGVDLRVHVQRCTSWWKGSGRHLKNTDRPAPSAVKATSTYRKNVRSLFSSNGILICRVILHSFTTLKRVNMVKARMHDKVSKYTPSVSWSGGRLHSFPSTPVKV